MALARLVIDGYGQLELNNAAFRRDGRIEAQCALDSTDFATAPCENGMLLAVDKANKVIKFATDASLPIAINYSAEHMYDERHLGLKNFYLTSNDFLPRLGLLAVGDKFTTNTICYDSATYADMDAVQTLLTAGTKVYAGIATDGSGYWQLVASAPAAGPVAQVVEVTDIYLIDCKATVLVEMFGRQMDMQVDLSSLKKTNN